MTTGAASGERTHPVGVDFGGSGIKAALVDTGAGTFVGDRVRVETPLPATPDRVASVVRDLLGTLQEDSHAPVGVTVPAVAKHGVVGSAANIDRSWVGVDADRLFTDALGRPVTVMNDADAAGYAEVRLGAAAGQAGLVIVATLGTGIGTALVYDGVLVPNSELGHLEIDGHDAESRAANSVRERKGLSYQEWAERLTRYFGVLEKLFSPDLFVVGGGVSKHADRFLHLIDVETPLVPATLLNRAGIVGAALLASEAPPHGG
jgi:polyphosphate glucokinase